MKRANGAELDARRIDDHRIPDRFRAADLLPRHDRPRPPLFDGPERLQDNERHVADSRNVRDRDRSGGGRIGGSRSRSERNSGCAEPGDEEAARRQAIRTVHSALPFQGLE